MTTLLPLIIACLIGQTVSPITPVQQGVANCDARAISETVEKRYSKGPLVMKGEYIRNWSHIEEPFVIHIQTRTIMSEGLNATVFYELVGDEKELVTGVVFVLDEVVEFLEDGSFIRYPSTSPFGSGDNDYTHGCTTASAWGTWIETAFPVIEYSSILDYFIDIIEHADFIQPHENGWTVHSASNGRIEEVDILSDGSIEVWRSRTLPGEEGTHSSLERQYRWFDSPVKTDVLRKELAVWKESPDLKSLEALVIIHVALAEADKAKSKSESKEPLRKSVEVEEGLPAMDEVTTPSNE